MVNNFNTFGPIYSVAISVNFVENPLLSNPLAVSHVLYGERLGLLQDHIDPDTQKFIDCITLMFNTTSPMLYIPPALLRRVGAKVWRDHVEAWDAIFSHGERLHRLYAHAGLLKVTVSKKIVP
ncbi:Cholesterol side-chain cleavage enzyme, mitochondrial [Acipenser ruthenus]|uniref:Cholesterol side-chain cleavage enzyme, mitochondrial n=1 Tax=Acipenser ruthenus TaxID=7906 RepID=A0A662YMU1_ACIRT|nr:Cholesterol side-chain cleavage enzyme, mitochondrial [Acipenser ruthenus]